jgi:polysaccharide export outer membrane protein
MLNPFLRLISILSVFASLASLSPAFQESYKVGKQDVLKIEVVGDADFSRDSAVVSDAGTISLPVLGELKVDGLTLSGIADLIRNSLIDRKLLTEPVVSVIVKDYKSQSITILGEVKATGKYYLRGSEKLFDKIVEVGGLTATAGDIVITRLTPDGPQNITVKGKELLRDTTTLKGGDVIVVQAREVAQIFISGEVVSGRAVNFVEGMTLSQAILMAGGLNRFGSKSKILLKRTVEGKETIAKVNLADIEKGKAKDIPLQPNDTIVVGRRVF